MLMQAVPVPVLTSKIRIRTRTALVASADRSFRQRLAQILTGLRWQVREAEGGAQAWAEAEATTLEAVIVDSWLPDLELAEFLKDFQGRFPQVDIVAAGGESTLESPRGPYRQELLYALRRCQDTDTAAWNTAPALSKPNPASDLLHVNPWPVPAEFAGAAAEHVKQESAAAPAHVLSSPANDAPACVDLPVHKTDPAPTERLPELIGNAPCMLEISRRRRQC
jgi:CheY-like chemotaxis protein